jgi:hypothetical protein
VHWRLPVHDSSSVVLAALDRVIGKPPWGHPGGKTGAACLGGSSRRGGYLDFVARALRSRGAEVTDDCRSERAATVGTWVVDAEGNPAVRVSLQQLSFVSDVEATTTIHEARGGRWGRSEECRVTRVRSAEPWAIASCTVLWTS